MTTYDDDVASALEQRVHDLSDRRCGEEVRSYVAYVETSWTDDEGQRCTDVRRIVTPGLNPYQAMGMTVVGSSRLERDLDPRHFPTVPAFVPAQSIG